MTNERKSEATMNLKDNVESRLSKEEKKALWRSIIDKFESGGESLVRAFIKERFDFWESHIFSEIESIKKNLPED